LNTEEISFIYLFYFNCIFWWIS